MVEPDINYNRKFIAVEKNQELFLQIKIYDPQGEEIEATNVETTAASWIWSKNILNEHDKEEAIVEVLEEDKQRIRILNSYGVLKVECKISNASTILSYILPIAYIPQSLNSKL
jgi:hypothetical protein